MKKFLFLFVLMTTTVAFAQNNYQDVIYLKNGSIIRGIIIEQVPNESLKIETVGSNLFVFKIDEVEKITKERFVEALNYNYVGGRKWYINYGGGANMIGNIAFGTATFELGYYMNPHNLLSFESGSGSYTENNIGIFDWYEQYSNGKTVNHSNGKINYDYSAFTLSASWNYIKDLSDRIQLRIGPSSGILVVSGRFVFDPSGLKGEPSKKLTSKAAFTFGANTGATWNFSTKKRWFLDLGWKFYGHTGINFEERNLTLETYNIKVEKKKFSHIGNQINLSIGWRFGKAR